MPENVKRYPFKNVDLASHAVFAVSNGGFERGKQYCLRWVREVVENKTRKPWSVPRGSDAWEAAQELTKQGLSVPAIRGSKIGDVLFQKPTPRNPHGHVGVRVAGNRVAENWSGHWRADRPDSRGFRTLEEFGRVDCIIRLGTD